VKKLFVLYDSSCGLCVRCARWLNDEPAYIEVEPIAAGSHKARTMFPALHASATPDELVVVADSGEVYRDLSAWLMCLYALKRYRSWSIRLSRPGWQGLARRAVKFLSESRDTVSGILGFRASFNAMAAAEPAGACASGACGTTARLNERVRDIRASGGR
jgi:predicted DCC family thiol-disulfide oxidoreductase YuxK